MGREDILNKADILIKDKIKYVKSIVLTLCYDRDFCRKVGINYNNIQSKDSRLIKTTITDYLLRNKEK